MKVVHNLKPIYDKNSRILILGSMPSTVSRNSKFYYANKSNRFWKILELLFNEKFESEVDKKNFLIENNIALWDVIKSCDITGSSDSTIKNIAVNNINLILKSSKTKYIFCTGKKAYEIFNKFFNVNIDVIYLPSPSSANAKLSLNDLVSKYKKIIDSLKK